MGGHLRRGDPGGSVRHHSAVGAGRHHHIGIRKSWPAAAVQRYHQPDYRQGAGIGLTEGVTMAKPTAPLGTPNNVTQTIGPGQLWVADFGDGSLEASITSASAALPSGMRSIGYTDAGTEMAYTYSTDNITVAEEVEPLGTPVTAVAGAVSFTMAEATADNLLLVLNNGSKFVGGYVAPAIPGSEKTTTIVQECPS